MRELDKAAMGKRIRQIRLGAGLRQWELARLLGTTQSAVHKYEHGVVPEPRRLIELARVGETSVEWVLTGRHWENGSEEQQRVAPELLDTAHLLRDLTGDDRRSIDEALTVVRDALAALAPDDGEDTGSPGAVATALGDLGEDTLRLLESAYRVQRAVLRRVATQAGSRLEAAATPRRPPRSARRDDDDGDVAAGEVTRRRR